MGRWKQEVETDSLVRLKNQKMTQELLQTKAQLLPEQLNSLGEVSHVD